MDTIELQLAHYRAKVKEVFFDLLTQTGSSPPMTHSESIQSQPSKPLIVVIEDNLDEWFLVQWTLTRQFPDAALVWLADDKQTWAYLETLESTEQSLPIMILLDLYLPSVKAGLSLLQCIKSNPLIKDVPLITLSRSAKQEDIHAAFIHRSDGFIVKPDTCSDWRDSFRTLTMYWKLP